MPEDGLRDASVPENRQGGLSQILRLVHAEQSPARTLLTDSSGLSRSTVAKLVAELTTLGLIREVEAPSRGLGRPSKIVIPTNRAVSLVAHPSEAGVTIATVGLGGRVLNLIQRPWDHVPNAANLTRIVCATLTGMKAQLDANHEAVGLVISVPDSILGRDGRAISAFQLGWSEIRLRSVLEVSTSMRVRVVSSTAAAALGESTFGVGRGSPVMVYLHGHNGSNIGALVSHGRLIRGANGIARDFGHILVRSDGMLCRCGRRGCLEAELRARSMMVNQIGTPDDSRSMAANLFAIAIDTIERLVDPDLVVLAGELAPYLTISSVGQVRLRSSRFAPPGHQPNYALASDHDEKSLVGAAEFVFRPYLENLSQRERRERLPVSPTNSAGMGVVSTRMTSRTKLVSLPSSSSTRQQIPLTE